MLSLAAIVLQAAPVRCVPLSNPEIGQQVAIPPSLQREVVLLPSTLDEGTIKALAMALHTEAELKDGRWRLVRTEWALTDLKKADLAWMKHLIQESVARYEKRMRPFAKVPIRAPLAALQRGVAEVESRQLHYDESTLRANEVAPSARLFADLLPRLTDEALAKAAPGTIGYFSNVPVGIEQLFPLEEDAFKAYEKSLSEFAAWSRDNQTRIPQKYRGAFPTQEPLKGKRTVILGVHRQSQVPFFYLQVFNAAGKGEGGQTWLVNDPDEMPTSEAATLGKVPFPASARQAVGNPNELRPESLDPAAQDPLDRYVRDALLLWGKAKGFDRVVACVPDLLYRSVKSALSPDAAELDLDRLSSEIARSDCEAVPLGEILVIRPAHPLQEEAVRLDRKPLIALHQAAAKGRFGLEDLFTYHAAYIEKRWTSEVIGEWERPIVSAFKLDRKPWNLPWPLLGALGSLSALERRRLNAGERIPLGEPRFVPVVRALTFYASVFGEPPREAPEPSPPGVIVRRMRPEATVLGSDLDRTYTRLLARQGNRYLESAPGPVTTLVQTVVRSTGKAVDSDFVSPELIVPRAQLDPRLAYEYYVYNWVQEMQTSTGAVLPNATVGPATFRFRGKVTGPVRLDQVPGWNARP